MPYALSWMTPIMLFKSIHEPKGKFVIGMVVTGDPAPVAANENGKLLKRSRSLPGQLCFLTFKEASDPSWVVIIPKLPKRIFHQKGLMRPFV